MKPPILIILPLLLYVIASTASPQSENTRTGVYLSFERAGKLDPLFTGESNERIWLRLHNHSGRTICFPFFEVEEQYGQVGVFYKVLLDYDPFISEKNSDGDWVLRTRPIPLDDLPKGYDRREREESASYSLMPGGSIVFSVAREHLASYLAVGISYNYEGEGDRITKEGKMRRNHIQYSYTELPEGVAKE